MFMKARSQRGIAILAVLVFAAVALPLVIILMNLLATHRVFGTSQYSREIMDNYSSNGIREALDLISTSRPYLVSCDPLGRVNDQVNWVNPSSAFDYLAAYWIRWPFVQSARYYGTLDGNIDPDLAATSLIAYPWQVYRDDDSSTGGDCLPDDLTITSDAYDPEANLRLIVAFAPYGRRNALFPSVSGTPGYPGDFIWPPTPTSPLVRLQATDPFNDSLFASLRTWVRDPSVFPNESAYSGQMLAAANDRFNPYRRTDTLGLDPLLPAEGFTLPAGNLGYLHNDTGRLITAAPGMRTFDSATDGIPAGFEVSISDEGARLPLYDWFHNPDDALFYNPYDYGTPAEPFNLVLAATDFPQADLLDDAWRQQIRSLGFLVKGLGLGLQYPPARSIITHIGYYDIGDQGRPSPPQDRDYPDGERHDFDGNGIVDEPMTRFPSSLKQVLDANRILSESPAVALSYSEVSTEAFGYLKAQATTIQAPQNAYQQFEDPLIRRAYSAAGSGITTKYPIWQPWGGWPVSMSSACPSQPESEPNDFVPTANPAGILCVHEGTVAKVNVNCTGPSDCNDYWWFTTPSARKIRIVLVGPDPNPNADIQLTLYGSGMTVLGTVVASGGGGQGTLSGITIQPGITYFIHIEPFDPPPAATRQYRFIIQFEGQSVCRNVFVRPQDCLISEIQPLSPTEYNTYNNLGGAWQDPAALYPFWLRTVLNDDLDGDTVGDVQERYNALVSYLTPLTDPTVAGLLARRHTGHWGAWQYFYRYIPSGTLLFDCLGIGTNRLEEHARYHGVGDFLLPVPTPGPWYDPGNVLNNSDCPGAGRSRADWPTIFAPVDIDGNGVFDPANSSNPYPPCPAGRDCMQQLFASGGLGVDAVYEIPDRLPDPIAYDGSRQRLNDESLLFQLAAGILEGTSPYLTYFDSNANTVDSNTLGIDPNPVNEICDPQGLRIVSGTSVTAGVGGLPKGQYYPADGRTAGAIYTDPFTSQLVPMSGLCRYSPDLSPHPWPDQLPDSERPLAYRLRININTATFHTLAGLAAKFSSDGDSNSTAQRRASRFAQSVTLYREWFHRTPNLPMNHRDHGILRGWINDPDPFPGSILNLDELRDNASSLLTSYLFNVLSNPTIVGTPLVGAFDLTNPSVDTYIAGKLSFPSDRLNPPFRNIGQLLDVRYITNRTTDPRNLDDDASSVCRVLALRDNSCSSSLPPQPSAEVKVASDPVRYFARIDQDIAVKSYGYRIESFGRIGDSLRQKAIVVYRSLNASEVEWQQQDLTPIATKYY
jgi:hypothetical protein